MGRRFDAIPDRLTAYTADILGSLAGIAAFGALSYWHVPSTFWFVISLALGLYFTPRLRWLHAAAALGALFIIGAPASTGPRQPRDESLEYLVALQFRLLQPAAFALSM